MTASSPGREGSASCFRLVLEFWSLSAPLRRAGTSGFDHWYKVYGEMLLHIRQLLQEGEVRALLDMAERGTFEDGRTSAGGALHDVKHNEQMKCTKEDAQKLQAIVMNALNRKDEFQQFALPKKLIPPRISRYGEGMGYGNHFDNPIMTAERGEPVRTDLSITIFLTGPESYDGGDLCLETPFGRESFKLPVGDAVVYSTTMRHRVEPVTRGVRLVIVSWIQSLVKDLSQREILWDLKRAREAVKEQLPRSEASDLLLKVHTAVFKWWTEV